jgi:hypothetical protein
VPQYHHGNHFGIEGKNSKRILIFDKCMTESNPGGTDAEDSSGIEPNRATAYSTT